jgi:hypothetical protein
MMNHAIAFAILAASLAACAKSTEIRGPGGQVAQLIECNGAANSISTCYEEANELCPVGYAVLDAQQINGPIIANQYGFTQGVSRQLVIQCQG